MCVLGPVLSWFSGLAYGVYYSKFCISSAVTDAEGARRGFARKLPGEKSMS